MSVSYYLIAIALFVGCCVSVFFPCPFDLPANHSPNGAPRLRLSLSLRAPVPVRAHNTVFEPGRLITDIGRPTVVFVSCRAYIAIPTHAFKLSFSRCPSLLCIFQRFEPHRHARCSRAPCVHTFAFASLSAFSRSVRFLRKCETVGPNTNKLAPVAAVPVRGFVNALAFAPSGKFLVAGPSSVCLSVAQLFCLFCRAVRHRCISVACFSGLFLFWSLGLVLMC